MPPKPLTQEELDAQNTALGRTRFNTGPAKVGTSITSESLQPQTAINVPPAPVDTTNYQGIVTGGNTAISSLTPAPTTTTPESGLSSDIQKLLGSISAPASAEQAYTSAFDTGIAPKEQAVAESQKKLDAINAQLAAINAEQTAIPIQTQQEATGRGVTAAGLAPITTARLRENALKALPLQAQAFAAQAEVTGNENLLKLAQDRLDTVFKLRSEDETRKYNYQKDIRDKIYETLNTQEKARVDALQKEDDRKFELMKDNINNAQALAKTAIENGQAGIAAQITSLDPKSTTYSEDVAKLSGQIAPKPASASAPTSYKEWELAGKPGTYAQWLKDANIKAPTVAQQTVAEYAARLEQSTPILETLTPIITGMNLLNFNAQLKLPPTFQSTEMQQYMQAASNFINAKLRRESGAVISPTEFTEARSQYLPQPGDKPEVLKQKKANRDLVFSSLRKAAGNAYESVNDLLAQDQGMGATGMGTVGAGQPGTVEYPIGSGKKYSVDAQGNMTPL